MAKKITVCILCGLMVLGMAIAVANFISVQTPARPCVEVVYHASIPDCGGPGKGCWDCTNPQV